MSKELDIEVEGTLKELLTHIGYDDFAVIEDENGTRFVVSTLESQRDLIIEQRRKGREEALKEVNQFNMQVVYDQFTMRHITHRYREVPCEWLEGELATLNSKEAK